MTTELKKRILTSIILFIAVIFSILVHKLIFIFVLIMTLFISFYEWSNINNKYFNKNDFQKILIKFQKIKRNFGKI